MLVPTRLLLHCWHWQAFSLTCKSVGLETVPPLWPKSNLHLVRASRNKPDSHGSIDILVKKWILQVMVVGSNSRTKENRANSKPNSKPGRSRVGQTGIAHQTGCIDHVQLIHQLPRVFKSSVEHETSKAHKEVAKVGNLENRIVSISSTALDTFPGTVPVHDVRPGIHDLGRVIRGIVVLSHLSWALPRAVTLFLPLHTTVTST